MSWFDNVNKQLRAFDTVISLVFTKCLRNIMKKYLYSLQTRVSARVTIHKHLSARGHLRVPIVSGKGIVPTIQTNVSIPGIFYQRSQKLPV